MERKTVTEVQSSLIPRPTISQLLMWLGAGLMPQTVSTCVKFENPGALGIYFNNFSVNYPRLQRAVHIKALD